ncbi:MAG: hypothetical protein HC834_01770 [Rhodospirillales bacterium]|nr:hypothetical protein [Rhodospirillales bacterium]
MLDRLIGQASRLSREGPFSPPPAMAAMIGCTRTDLVSVLRALGYRSKFEGNSMQFCRPARRRNKAKERTDHHRQSSGNPDSPFALLETIKTTQ